MRYLPFLLVFLLPSCNLNEELTPPTSEDCETIHSASLTLEPMSESILIEYGFSNINFFIETPGPPPVSCPPETIELLISTDGINFENVTTLENISGSYLIENLQDCDWVTVRLRGSHPDLGIVATERSTVVGEIPLPQFMNNPLYMGEFMLANDGHQLIYGGSSSNWYLSSLSNITQGQQIFSDVNRVRWNPTESNKVAGVENILVPILTNTNGISSKYLVEYDLNTGTTEILHEIENHMDYDNSVYKPELYWIHEFRYSLDGQSIYFISNKDNGGSSIFDQKVYDNIWKLDLATKEIEVITDFLPIEFDLVDFVEDPKQPGNFYISGGERDVQVVTDDNVYFIDRVDIHYYNSVDKSITPIFVSNEETEYLSINPTGENLLFTTMASGKAELRSLHIASQKQKQISYTHNNEYLPTNRWLNLNWISPTEFITGVRRDGDGMFATFSIE